MTASWSSRHQAGKDATWAAWRRLTVEPIGVVVGKDEIPPVLARLAEGLAGPLEATTSAVLDEMAADFGREARERILTDALSDMVRHVLWAIGGAVGTEMARPEPMPFTPPAAGSWIRARWLSKPSPRQRRLDTGPRWDGAWHRFTGDVKVGDERTHDVVGGTRCGRSVPLRSFNLFDGNLSRDAVAVEAMPDVDYCRRCGRS